MTKATAGVEEAGKQVRRRGAALEEALLEAAWQELSTGGYGNFTIDAVAARAHTSRAVIYRRWPERWDLILATVGYYQRSNPVGTPDTGNLRDDLITFLNEASEKRAAFATMLSVRMAEYYDTTRTSPAEVRDALTRGRTSQLDTVFDRAVGRGEIDAAVLTPRVRTLPFDLLRSELLMHQRPVPTEIIEAIVDEIVLPLVTRTR